MAYARPSNCSVGVAVDFYWLNEPSMDPDRHILAAVDALMDAIRSDGRAWSAHRERLDRAEFRNRLEKARRGELRPRSDVKPLRGGQRPLFEIRWQDIPVADLDRTTQTPHFYNTVVRLITAEPTELGLGVLGLLAHEKRPDSPVKASQDSAIDQAERLYDAGIPSQWGVTKRDKF